LPPRQLTHSKILSTPFNLAKLLLVLVVIEFVSIRLLSRIGSVPPRPWLLNAYEAMLRIGSVAFSLAAVLVIVLGLLFAQRIITGKSSRRVLGLSLVALYLIGLLTLVGGGSVVLSIAFSVIAALVCALLISHLSLDCNRTVLRVTKLLAILGIASIFYFKLIPQIEYLAGRNLSFLSPLGFYFVGEAATLAATAMISIGFLFRNGALQVSKKALATATITLASVSVFYWMGAWLLSLIAMWTLGFTMFLPFPFYAVILFLFTYAVVTSWQRSQPWIAIGLMFLFFAGRLAQLGYLTMLMVAGLAMLSYPEHFAAAELSTVPAVSHKAHRIEEDTVRYGEDLVDSRELSLLR